MESKAFLQTHPTPDIPYPSKPLTSWPMVLNQLKPIVWVKPELIRWILALEGPLHQASHWPQGILCPAKNSLSDFSPGRTTSGGSQDPGHEGFQPKRPPRRCPIHRLEKIEKRRRTHRMPTFVVCCFRFNEIMAFPRKKFSPRVPCASEGETTCDGHGAGSEPSVLTMRTSTLGRCKVCTTASTSGPGPTSLAQQSNKNPGNSAGTHNSFNLRYYMII